MRPGSDAVPSAGPALALRRARGPTRAPSLAGPQAARNVPGESRAEELLEGPFLRGVGTTRSPLCVALLGACGTSSLPRASHGCSLHAVSDGLGGESVFPPHMAEIIASIQTLPLAHGTAAMPHRARHCCARRPLRPGRLRAAGASRPRPLPSLPSRPPSRQLPPSGQLPPCHAHTARASPMCVRRPSPFIGQHGCLRAHGDDDVHGGDGHPL